jgi:tRNA threonylcarbamoyladenosine biosynthesis protein TsaB
MQTGLADRVKSRNIRKMTDTPALVFETSTPRASLALVGPDGVVAQREFTGDRSHNAALFSPLRELLEEGNRKELRLVVVGSGPGSYSGTRVGIAAAQGVAIAAGCPAVAVPSLLAVSAADHGAACLAIGDARRGGYWTAASENARPELTDKAGLEAIVRKALADGRTVFTFEDPARFPLSADLLDQIRLEFPDATRLWHVWENAAAETRARWLAVAPQPIYLKPPHITPAKKRSPGLR